MRAPIGLLVLVLALPAIFATGVAQAKIKPIPRPAKLAKPAASSGGAAIAPLRKPVAHKAVRTPRAPTRTTTRRRAVKTPVRVTRTTRAKRPARATRTHRKTRVLARSRGGRYLPPARSYGGRRHVLVLPPAPVAPSPTPLGFVAFGEMLPSEGGAWPAWVSSLLGALAASEAFLLVHLVRARSFA